MSKQFVQRNDIVLQSTASLGASASISGSAPCSGYSKLVGGIITNASSVAGSGLSVRQSFDGGDNWDYVTACQIAACDGDGFLIDVIGDAVEVFYKTDSAASLVRMKFQLRPIS